jgi:TPR repeat protein
VSVNTYDDQDVFTKAIIFHGQKKYEDAFPLFLKSAEKGNPEAQHKLAWMYALGNGTPKDTAQALLWYLKAAQQGYAKSQYNLGMLYLEELHDEVQSLRWLREAAEQNWPSAEYNLGVFFANGSAGLSKDKSQAKKWMERAKIHGYKETKMRP